MSKTGYYNAFASPGSIRKIIIHPVGILFFRYVTKRLSEALYRRYCYFYCTLIQQYTYTFGAPRGGDDGQ